MGMPILLCPLTKGDKAEGALKEKESSMKKRMGKRGFTIVELVIVIAVIAILAAVLIPTFSNLINKANVTSDQAAVRNMNLALAADEATGKPENLTDVLTVLGAAGMDAKDYKALSKDHKFVWDSTLNRVLYVESATNTVVYPEQYAEGGYTWGTWVTLTGQIAGDDSWQQIELTEESFQSETVTRGCIKTNGAITAAKVDSAETLISATEYLEKNGSENFRLVLGADIDLKNAEWKPLREYKGTFDGNGKTVSGLRMSDRTADSNEFKAQTTGSNYTFYGFVSVFSGSYFGNVTIDADIDEPGSAKDPGSGYNHNNHTTAGAIGAVMPADGIGEVTVENVTVTGKIVGYSRVAGVIGFIGGYSGKPMTADVTVKNCVNKATVLTENKTNEDFGTAAGIVSTSNQRAPGTVVTLTGCKNEGQVEGQYVAGMIGSIFRSNSQTEADADSAAATTKMIFDQCENTGKLICNVYERYYKTVNKTYCNGYVAGIVAYAYNERYSVEITNCTVSGEVQTHRESTVAEQMIYTGTYFAKPTKNQWKSEQEDGSLFVTLTGGENVFGKIPQ